MSINDSALEKVRELSEKYKETWGKEVDYGIAPDGLTQEKLVKCLELMVEDNLSLAIAYAKLFNNQEDFSEK